MHKNVFFNLPREKNGTTNTFTFRLKWTCLCPSVQIFFVCLSPNFVSRILLSSSDRIDLDFMYTYLNLMTMPPQEAAPQWLMVPF